MSSSHPLFKVLPWNGHQAALSLTFDDGNPVHLDFVVPELARRSLRGTFYVIANRLADPNGWKAILASGQEIGNHSLDHKHAQDLSPAEEQLQVAEAKEKLEDLFSVPIPSFAYPFTDITPSLRAVVGSCHFLGRGGNRSSFYLDPQAEPDWLDIPSQVALTRLPLGEYQTWVDENLNRASWTVLQFHGIEGDGIGWEPLPKDIFLSVLDHLVGKGQVLWVAPFSEVGAYWRAQKVLERTPPQEQGNLKIFSWKRPALLPKGTVLKLRPAKGTRLFQDGLPLKTNADDSCSISFDTGELVLQT